METAGRAGTSATSFDRPRRILVRSRSRSRRPPRKCRAAVAERQRDRSPRRTPCLFANGSLTMAVSRPTEFGQDLLRGVRRGSGCWRMISGCTRNIARAEGGGQPAIADLIRAERIHGSDSGSTANARRQRRVDGGMTVGRGEIRPGGDKGRPEAGCPSRCRTVWRKLPTMIPTAVIIAMAVDSAPTSTDVRRSDAARLRDASSASTPSRVWRSRREPRTERTPGRNRERRASDQEHRGQVAEQRLTPDRAAPARPSAPPAQRRTSRRYRSRAVHAGNILAPASRHRLDGGDRAMLPTLARARRETDGTGRSASRSAMDSGVDLDSRRAGSMTYSDSTVEEIRRTAPAISRPSAIPGRRADHTEASRLRQERRAVCRSGRRRVLAAIPISGRRRTTDTEIVL